MRWSCCRMPELEAGGCTELCDLCGQVCLNSAQVLKKSSLPRIENVA